MIPLSKKYKRILIKYSTLANILTTLSTAGLGGLALFTNDMTTKSLVVCAATLCSLGFLGNFLKEEIEDAEDELEKGDKK